MEKAFSDPGTTPAGELKRVRSWLLIKVDKKEDEIKTIAHNLFKDWGDPNKDNDIFLEKVLHRTRNTPGDLIVIRADVVEVEDNLYDFNLIVPVDAIDEDALGRFKDHIHKLDQGIHVVEVRVINHFPEAPYLSNGYISNEEARLGIQKAEILPESLGLTRRSPGDNPWG